MFIGDILNFPLLIHIMNWRSSRTGIQIRSMYLTLKTDIYYFYNHYYYHNEGRSLKAIISEGWNSLYRFCKDISEHFLRYSLIFFSELSTILFRTIIYKLFTEASNTIIECPLDFFLDLVKSFFHKFFRNLY